MSPKKTTVTKSSVTGKKKQTNTSCVKGKNGSSFISEQNADKISEFEIASKILDNDLLFDEDFVQQQKNKLTSLMVTEKSFGKFHEMPEENLSVSFCL